MKTGKDLLALARTRLGEKYVFGALAPKDDRGCHGPWDCAEFVSWTIYQVAGILYGCNNDAGDPARADAGTLYWGRDANSRGRKISADMAAGIPGAAVLRLASGNQCGHIVFSDGQGGTVEAADSRRGVIRSTLSGRRWTCGILPAGIDYGSPLSVPLIEVQPPAATIYYLSEPMMRGEAVFKIQCRLNHLGYLRSDQTDWIYGPKTAYAVQNFQKGHGLVADGEAGPLTLSALGVTL